MLRERAVACAQQADAVIVVVGHNKDSEGEGGDRTSMDLPGQTNQLVSEVCAANARSVVVVQSASAVTMPWEDDASAIVMAWYQGQENGRALTNALLGRCSFSGKLPITIPKRLGDHGSSAWFPGEAGTHDRCTFGEGIMFGYRHFERYSIQPQWPFSHGLSYTRFTVSDIRVSTTVSAALAVTVYVTNTGDRDGHEVIQVYISPSSRIAETGLDTYHKTLSGFAKIAVPQGARREIRIEVPRKELRWYNESTGRWQTDVGSCQCFVGTSSANICYQASFEVV
ncbi:hypothetical protein ACHAPT_012412 [Fusarium lateritium]